MTSEDMCLFKVCFVLLIDFLASYLKASYYLSHRTSRFISQVLWFVPEVPDGIYFVV